MMQCSDLNEAKTHNHSFIGLFYFYIWKSNREKRANFIFILETREKEINNIYKFVNESSINKFY